MVMDGVQVTPYREGQRQAVIDLILPIQRGEFGVAITAEDQPDLGNIPDFYQHGRGNFWVALHGGEVVGTISLLDIGDRCVALRKMFVKKEYRGSEKGVAALLLEKSVHWAHEKGIRAMYLGTVATYHGAHRFYEKNGFAQLRKSALPAAFPVMEVDTMFYVRTFSQHG